VHCATLPQHKHTRTNTHRKIGKVLKSARDSGRMTSARLTGGDYTSYTVEGDGEGDRTFRDGGGMTGRDALLTERTIAYDQARRNLIDMEAENNALSEKCDYLADKFAEIENANYEIERECREKDELIKEMEFKLDKVCV